QVSVVFCVALASRDADMAGSLGLSREAPLRSIATGVALYLGIVAIAAVAAAIFAVVGGVDLGAVLAAARPRGGADGDARDVLRAVGGVPAPMLLPLAAFVGFYEELCFRGFLLGRLRVALGDGAGSGLVAVVSSSAVFAGGHVYKPAFGIFG